MKQLNQTQRQMMASSLEVDGRSLSAALTVVNGNVEEFQYRGAALVPTSEKAIELYELNAWILESIERLGLEGFITALRVA